MRNRLTSKTKLCIFSEIREDPETNQHVIKRKKKKKHKFFDIKNVIARIKTSAQELESKTGKVSQKIEQKLLREKT